METKAGDLSGLAEEGLKLMEPEVKVAKAAEQKPPVSQEIPDPEEDDLDDLDGESCDSVKISRADLSPIDMLDEFSPPKADLKEAPTSSGPGRPVVAKVVEEEPGIEGLTDEDFAKQLQAGMANLLGELESSVWFTTSPNFGKF